MSMATEMTRQEAAYELQWIRTGIDEYANTHIDPRLKKEISALDTAISALRPITREQVAEVWKGCDLCLDDSWQRILMIPKRFDHTNMLSAELAQFCPGCSRPLTDKAVDMVMERLEEVLNADTGSV